MIEFQILDVRVPAEIIHNWCWFLAFGIGLVLLAGRPVWSGSTPPVYSKAKKVRCRNAR